MTAASLAARCIALLAAPSGAAVVVMGPGGARLVPALRASVSLATAADAADAAIVSFLGARVTPGDRQALLAQLRASLRAGASLVVVDHNQPRTWGARVVGMLALARRGLRPARARYPVAREAAALGFTVERLRLAAGERVQLVVARRPA